MRYHASKEIVRKEGQKHILGKITEGVTGDAKLVEQELSDAIMHKMR